jgi:hypothetical protein
VDRSWVDAQFGASAAGLRQGIALGLKVANDEAGREHESSKFKRKRRPVYGTARYWYGLDAIAYTLERTVGATVLHLYGRPFAVVKGVLVYPWCYADALDIHHKAVPVRNVSGLRQDLFAVEAARRAPWQTRIDFVSTDSGPQVAVNSGLDDDDEEDDPRAILVAYASNPQAGLLRIVLGDVELHPDRHLEWRNEEEVQIAEAVAGDIGVTISDIEGLLNERFDFPPEPDIEIHHRDDSIAEGDHIEDKQHGDPDGPDEEEGKSSRDVS